MNKKIKRLIVPLVILAILGTTSFAAINGIVINDETFLKFNKEKTLLSNFDKSYDVENNLENEDSEIKDKITELTKRTTYLLLGEANSENESSEDYYKRHKDYLELRYNPDIPKDANSELDKDSQEYKDDVVSGISVPGMFLKLNELDIKYNSYGRVKVAVVDDKEIISSITLKNIKMKKQSNQDPMKYDIVKTDLKMYYFFKKLNEEYKLFYLYGETNDDLESNSNEEKRISTTNEDYDSKLENVYDFSKAKAITDETLKNIYNENKSKVVFLNSLYNSEIITSANGFFINEGLIITTYNFVEKSLVGAQDIIISDTQGIAYELDGIVTMNADNDTAILKVKNKNLNFIQIQDSEKRKKEDAIISLNSKDGAKLTTSRGIIIAPNKSMETSVIATEEIQGSPLFNIDGKLVGMINSKTLDMSVSSATDLDIVKAYYEKFLDKKVEEIKSVSFKELKENYYIKYNEEKDINKLQTSKLSEFKGAENIDNLIKLKLVKSFYKDGIVSLRYKNEIYKYIDTMYFAGKFKEELKNNGYEEKNISKTKAIYERNKNKIIIMTEFNYLIIIMVKG